MGDHRAGVEEPPDRAAVGGGLARARVGAIFIAVILWCMLVAAAPPARSDLCGLGADRRPTCSAAPWIRRHEGSRVVTAAPAGQDRLAAWPDLDIAALKESTAA